MIIKKKGDELWFCGKAMKCGICGCEFTTEPKDRNKVDMTGSIPTMRCPACGMSVYFKTEIRAYGNG